MLAFAESFPWLRPQLLLELRPPSRPMPSLESMEADEEAVVLLLALLVVSIAAASGGFG